MSALLRSSTFLAFLSAIRALPREFARSTQLTHNFKFGWTNFCTITFMRADSVVATAFFLLPHLTAQSSNFLARCHHLRALWNRPPGHAHSESAVPPTLSPSQASRRKFQNYNLVNVICHSQQQNRVILATPPSHHERVFQLRSPTFLLRQNSRLQNLFKPALLLIKSHDCVIVSISLAVGS